MDIVSTLAFEDEGMDDPTTCSKSSDFRGLALGANKIALKHLKNEEASNVGGLGCLVFPNVYSAKCHLPEDERVGIPTGEEECVLPGAAMVWIRGR